MIITEIIHLGVDGKRVEDMTREALEIITGIETLEHFVIGAQIQDKSAIQITTESSETSPDSTALVDRLTSTSGQPQTVYHVSFNKPALGPNGPATAPIVEFAQSYFPASKVAPDFQRQIEQDFVRFDEIFTKGAKGNLSWTSGWVVEEQDHEGMPAGEKARCFFVVRGWESMESFQESVGSEAFGVASRILYAWNVPFKMWHVERKSLG